MPLGAGYSQGGTTNYNIVRLENVPFVCAGNNRPYEPVITSQGSGNQTFSFRVWHTHWMSWYAVDQTGLENWTSGTARASSPLLPQFSAQEQLYWKQTGTVPPLRLTQTPSDPTSYGNWLTNYYEPLSRNNIIGGSGVGGRSDLGLVNEYWAQAFLLETPTAWQRARVFSLGSTHYPYGSLLNEATGRIPVINNGPPAANHGGSGSPYPTLGAPHPQIYIGDNSASDFNNVIQPLEDIPVNTGTGMRYTGGIWGGGRVWANDHDPSFGNGMYTIFGSRHYLDALYFNGNRAGYVVTYGGVGYTDAIVSGVHYYGLYYDSYNERRGGFWAFREKMLPAALGGDSNPERTYFNDQLAENYWYGVALEASLDGSGNYRNSIAPPGEVNSEVATFMDGYGFMVSYQAYAMLRDPVASMWLPRWLRTYRAMCDETVPGHLSSYYCALYYYEPAVHDVSLLNNYLLNSTWGSAFNGSDASDVGTDEGQYQMFTAGSGTIQQQTAVLTLTNGDTVKFKGCGAPGCDFGPGPDQLRTDIWYTITNVNNATGTYQIINPSTGMPFASFTKGGSPLSGGYTMKLRPQYAPTTGWQHASYVPYAQALVYGLKDLGFSAINTAINVMTNRGFVDPGPTLTNMNWDPNVVVP
jgi:hypothetical protein